MLRYLLQSLLLVFLVPVILFSQETENSLLEQGDQALESFDYKTALSNYEKVLSINPNNYEANWKTSRAYVDIGEDLEDEEERAVYYKKSETYARAAIKSDSLGSFGHLYLSISLGRVALDAGAKERIRLSKEIKKEAELAIKYDPENDLAYHVLGRWHRKIANLSWIERGFADIFLGGVPKDASNNGAARNLSKAIELAPSYINHHLQLGITYETMGDVKSAIIEFEKCLSIKSNDPKDKKRKITAQEHINDLK